MLAVRGQVEHLGYGWRQFVQTLSGGLRSHRHALFCRDLETLPKVLVSLTKMGWQSLFHVFDPLCLRNRRALLCLWGWRRRGSRFLGSLPGAWSLCGRRTAGRREKRRDEQESPLGQPRITHIGVSTFVP